MGKVGGVGCGVGRCAAGACVCGSVRGSACGGSARGSGVRAWVCSRVCVGVCGARVVRRGVCVCVCVVWDTITAQTHLHTGSRRCHIDFLGQESLSLSDQSL